MPKPGRLWIAVDTGFLNPCGNKHDLDDAAVLAYLRCVAWCKEQATDGVIPRRTADRFLNGTLGPLVTAGLLEVTGDHVTLGDYLKWNESQQQLEERRVADRERKSRTRLTGVQSREEKSRESGRTPPGIQTDSARSPDGFRPESERTRPVTGLAAFREMLNELNTADEPA